MKTKFHAGDVVYVRPVGTVATVSRVVVVEAIGAPPTGYLYDLSGLSCQPRDADDLELVEPGPARRLTLAHYPGSVS